MNVAGHDSNFTSSRLQKKKTFTRMVMQLTGVLTNGQQKKTNFNDSRTIWTNHARLALTHESVLDLDHVLLRNSFRDDDAQA